MADALVVIPTFNECGNIGPLIERIVALPCDLHVFVVDDGSPDGTADAVRAKQERYGSDRIRLTVRPQGKAGRGSACLVGFAHARDHGYGAVVEMDADLSHDPSDIPRLLRFLDDADVVVGSKYVRGGRVKGWGWHRHLLSRAANSYAKLVLRMPIRDYTNGFRCYGAKAVALLPDLHVDGTGFTVIPQVSYQLWKRGMRFREVPIVFTNRRHGTSNMSIREIAESFVAILRIRSHAFHLHVVQFLKFSLTGVFNAILDLGLLALFVEFGRIPLPVAVAVADVIAITSSFFINKHWTFQNRERRHLKQYAQFWLVYGTSIAIAVAVTWFLADVLHIWYILARVIAIPVHALWNYCWLHFRVFPSSRRAEAFVEFQEQARLPDEQAHGVPPAPSSARAPRTTPSAPSREPSSPCRSCRDWREPPRDES